jgi:hypothetical protein
MTTTGPPDAAGAVGAGGAVVAGAVVVGVVLSAGASPAPGWVGAGRGDDDARTGVGDDTDEGSSLPARGAAGPGPQPARAAAASRTAPAARARWLRTAAIVAGRRHNPGMAYDRETADRLRECLAGTDGVSEKPMFGGLAFLVDGHMAVAASGGGGLLLRCPPERTEEFAARPHVGRFVMRGREMTGWLRLDPPAYDADDDLRAWVEHGVAQARAVGA